MGPWAAAVLNSLLTAEKQKLFHGVHEDSSRKNKHVVDKTNLNDSFLWIPPRRQKSSNRRNQRLEWLFCCSSRRDAKAKVRSPSVLVVNGNVGLALPRPAFGARDPRHKKKKTSQPELTCVLGQVPNSSHRLRIQIFISIHGRCDPR